MMYGFMSNNKYSINKTPKETLIITMHRTQWQFEFNETISGHGMNELEESARKLEKALSLRSTSVINRYLNRYQIRKYILNNDKNQVKTIFIDVIQLKFHSIILKASTILKMIFQSQLMHGAEKHLRLFNDDKLVFVKCEHEPCSNLMLVT